MRDRRAPARTVRRRASPMYTSDTVTQGVRVQVMAQYSPEQSQPLQNQWFFLYTVQVSNEGIETVQLISRHWIITDADHQVKEVRGPGVVGKQPVLDPGESFQYTSGCPLSTPFGSMRGTYQMLKLDGKRFDVEIGPFALTEPYNVLH